MVLCGACMAYAQDRVPNLQLRRPCAGVSPERLHHAKGASAAAALSLLFSALCTVCHLLCLSLQMSLLDSEVTCLAR